MRKCISFKLFNLIILSFISQLHSQVIESNGIFFRSHNLNPDTLKISSNSQTGIQKSFSPEETSLDTSNLPYIKQDFIVNSFDGEYGADQRSVSAAIDGEGNYAFTWIDFRNGVKNIYAQFYNSNDERVGSNFIVNENVLTGNNFPFISANENGDFVIVWLQDFNNVMAQMISKDGQRIGLNIIVNTTWGHNTMEPSVAVNDDGSFLVMWASEQGDWHYQVFARLIDSNGNPVASEIIVGEPDKGISSIGQGKHIVSDGNNNYCITWSSYANTNSSNIYLQVINSAGQKIGANTLVSGLTDSSDNYFPVITSTRDGHFLIAWENSFGVGARIFNSGGYFVTDNLTIYSDQSSWHPIEVASNQDSTFLLFWLGGGYQYLQKLKTAGDILSDTVRVRYNSSKPIYSYRAGLTDIFNGNFFIAPENYDLSDENIYRQKFNIDLEPVGTCDKISDDVGSARQRKSIVKFNNSGESIILWEDERNGRNDLYAQVYDKDYNPVGDNFQINEAYAEYWNLYDKQVECLSDGSFIIVFEGYDSYSSERRIFLQLVSASGEEIGQSKLVKDKIYNYGYYLSLNVNSNDDILICWYNQYGAYLRKYNKTLNSISTESNFINPADRVTFSPFSISIDKDLNVLAVWKEYNTQLYTYDNKIKGRFFSSQGNSTSDIFIVDSTYEYVSYLKCKNYDKSYAILYKDNYKVHLKRNYTYDKEYSFYNTFYCYSYGPIQINILEFNNQKVFITYNSPLEAIGYYANDNKRTGEYFNLHQYYYVNTFSDEFNGSNSADIFNDNLMFAYESNAHNGTGYDIWANVRKIKSINFDRETFYAPSKSDVLYPNFPNPFNPKTKIAYEILTYHKVNLTVYDILGRVVKVLVDENQEKGLYEIEFDASGLASGVYFYKLEAFNTYAKKMILLR